MGMKADEQVLLRAEKWLAGDFDEATKRQVKHLIDNNQKELTESFYRDLEFGTGGLRGIMGVGTNRMNVYTVGMATQGLANYLAKTFAGEEIKVAVSHDCRNTAASSPNAWPTSSHRMVSGYSCSTRSVLLRSSASLSGSSAAKAA